MNIPKSGNFYVSNSEPKPKVLIRHFKGTYYLNSLLINARPRLVGVTFLPPGGGSRFRTWWHWSVSEHASWKRRVYRFLLRLELVLTGFRFPCYLKIVWFTVGWIRSLQSVVLDRFHHQSSIIANSLQRSRSGKITAPPIGGLMLHPIYQM